MFEGSHCVGWVSRSFEGVPPMVGESAGELGNDREACRGAVALPGLQYDLFFLRLLLVTGQEKGGEEIPERGRTVRAGGRGRS